MSDTADSVTGQTPRDRSRRGRSPGKEQVGRTQILDAAVACILELGFYRASTNEIARRANVSWGAIQYYFGSRENLMLSAVEELSRRFVSSVEQRHVQGDTVEERIASLYGLLAKQYSDPTYMARLQIMLNLQHDPDTSPDATASLSVQARQMADHIRRLLTEVLGPDAAHARGSALFHAIRGFALSLQLAEAVNPEHSDADAAEALSIFLAALAESERKARHTDPGASTQEA